MCLELLTELLYDKILSNTSKQNHIWHIIHTKNHAPQQYLVPYPHKLKLALTNKLNTEAPTILLALNHDATTRSQEVTTTFNFSSEHTAYYTISLLLAYFCLKLYFTAHYLWPSFHITLLATM